LTKPAASHRVEENPAIPLFAGCDSATARLNGYVIYDLLAQAAAIFGYSSSLDEPLGLPVELLLLDGLNT